MSCLFVWLVRLVQRRVASGKAVAATESLGSGVGGWGEVKGGGGGRGSMPNTTLSPPE